MTETVYCLDTSVWIAYLVPEGPRSRQDATDDLVVRAVRDGRVVAPAFAWAEVGSTLRKKVRAREIQPEESEALWDRFRRIHIDYLETSGLRQRSWEIAAQFALPTLYDASFLACTEVVDAASGALREFWTADDVLYLSLGARRPPYVRRLG